eukprot:6750380-Alexandrium_andersonii.AAC.1
MCIRDRNGAVRCDQPCRGGPMAATGWPAPRQTVRASEHEEHRRVLLRARAQKGRDTRGPRH